MNKKILGSVVGMVAVLALIGGGTFAAWDSQVTIPEQTVEAGHLTLNVTNDDTSAVTSTTIGPVYPGMAREVTYYVANADTSPSNMATRLTVDLSNLVEANPEDSALADQLVVNRIRTRIPNGTATPCTGAFSGTTQQVGPGNIPLRDVIDDPPVLLENDGDPAATPPIPGLTDGYKLFNGDGLCVTVDLTFPAATANNDSQNGVIKFDQTFTLEQDL